MNEDKAVLVTGGCGFIGSHTVEKLLAQQYRVIVLDDLSTGKRENIENFAIKMYKGDLTNEADVSRIFHENVVDYVIHLGAKLSVPESMTNPYIYQDTNVQGTFNVLKFAKEYEVKKVVLASTCAVEGNSYYGLSKKITEDIANWFTQNFNLKTTCLRYVNVYGERQAVVGEGAVVPAFIKVLLKKETPIIHGDGLQTRDFVYVKDVADANIHAMTSEFTGYSYIATGKETSILDLLKTLQALLEVYCATEFKPRREGDMMSVGYHYPDSKFGWEPKVALKEGLINTIEWLKKRV